MTENPGSSSQPTQPESGGKPSQGRQPPPPAPSSPPTQSPPGQQPPPAGSGQQGDNPLRGSRTSGVWIATAVIGILLVLLVIFIVQNTQQVDIAYLGWEGRLPLSAALMVATAAGILITTTAGGLRILQLRRRIKKETKAVKKAGKSEAKQSKAKQKDAKPGKSSARSPGSTPAKGSGKK